MDWGPVISGLLVAILILLGVPFLTEDFDEEPIKNQTRAEPITIVQTEESLILFTDLIDFCNVLFEVTCRLSYRSGIS